MQVSRGWTVVGSIASQPSPSPSGRHTRSTGQLVADLLTQRRALNPCPAEPGATKPSANQQRSVRRIELSPRAVVRCPLDAVIVDSREELSPYLGDGFGASAGDLKFGQREVQRFCRGHEA